MKTKQRYITVKLTEKQAYDVWRTVGYGMEDYPEEWSTNYERERKRVEKVNAYYQRLQDKIAKQINEQIS